MPIRAAHDCRFWSFLPALLPLQYPEEFPDINTALPQLIRTRKLPSSYFITVVICLNHSSDRNRILLLWWRYGYYR